MPRREVLADHTHRFRAPLPRVVEALTGSREWFEPTVGDVRPAVRRSGPGLVVWDSPWMGRPDDTVEFALSSEGRGSVVRVRWLSDAPSADAEVDRRSARLDREMAGALRLWLTWPLGLRPRPRYVMEGIRWRFLLGTLGLGLSLGLLCALVAHGRPDEDPMVMGVAGSVVVAMSGSGGKLPRDPYDQHTARVIRWVILGIGLAIVAVALVLLLR